MKTSHFKFTVTAFVAYAIAVLLIAFWPTPVDRPMTGTLAKVIAWFHRHGMPGFIGYRDIEFAANVVFFMPMGIIITLWTHKPWRTVVIGTYASLTIELLQALALPQRYSSVFDIIANTLGAAIGALLLCPLTAWLIARYDARNLATKQESSGLEDRMGPSSTRDD